MKEKHINKHHVLIKGTKDGLTFFLNDQCTFEDLVCELEDKLSERLHSKPEGKGKVKVKLVLGKRYLKEDQMDKLENILAETMNGLVDMVDSDIITKEEAQQIYESKSIRRIERVVRSGQVIDVESDVLLIGDVNPGGTVRAKGNIYIMGKLLGSAHAGYAGNGGTMIYASQLQPTQLIINETRWDIPEDDDSFSMMMGCAYLNDNEKMEIEEIIKLMTKNPSVFQMYHEEKKHN